MLRMSLAAAAAALGSFEETVCGNDVLEMSLKLEPLAGAGRLGMLSDPGDARSCEASPMGCETAAKELVSTFAKPVRSI